MVRHALNAKIDRIAFLATYAGREFEGGWKQAISVKAKHRYPN